MKEKDRMEVQNSPRVSESEKEPDSTFNDRDGMSEEILDSEAFYDALTTSAPLFRLEVLTCHSQLFGRSVRYSRNLLPFTLDIEPLIEYKINAC